MARVGSRSISLAPVLSPAFILIVVVAALAVAVATSEAQPAPVVVRGTIRDTSEGVLADARIEVLLAGRLFASATSGDDGRYEVNVPAGVPAQVRVTLDGFAEQIVDLAGARDAIDRDIVLRVGGVSDTLVVTASRGAESRARVTESVTVATKADIEALGSTSLADVVRFVPGVSVESAGREGALTSVFSRGGESDYNLMLIDGVRVNISGGQFDFARIAAGEIERVEVVRGAQSSLWGSDAMGSVVQIFTKRAAATDAPQASASIEGGSFGTWRGDVRVLGGAQRRVDYQAGTTHRRSEGAFADLLPEDDRFTQAAGDAGVGIALGTRANVRSGVRYSEGNGRSVGPIRYGSRDTGGVYDTKDLSWHGTLAHAVGARFTGTATINYFRYENESGDAVVDSPYATFAVLEGTPDALFPDGTRLVRLIDRASFDALVAAGALPAPGQFLASRETTDSTFTSRSEFRRPAVRYQGDYTWAGGQRLSAGYEWERESDPLADVSLDNHAWFVQQQFTLRDRWFATVGGRVDSKDTYDRFFSPKLSAGGFVVPDRRGVLSSMKVFGNVGKGIKSPTFGERFGSSFADSDPGLEVEKARTADAGVEATFADQRLRASLTYFDNAYTDQIAFRPGVAGDGIPEYINIDGSEAHGWELEAALQRSLFGFTAGATYALVDTQVVTNVSTSQQFQPGQPLLRRPRHSGTIRVGFSHGRASVHFNLRLVGRRHDNSFLSLRTVPNAERPTAITTDITVNPGYAVATLGLDYRVLDGVTIYLRGDNLGDTEYESALGYPGLPRAVVAGARVRFGAR